MSILKPTLKERQASIDKLAAATGLSEEQVTVIIDSMDEAVMKICKEKKEEDKREHECGHIMISVSAANNE